MAGGNFRIAESGEHAAADGLTMSLAKLGVLLLLLPLLILIAAGIGGERHRRKAPRTAGLRVGFRVGVRVSKVIWSCSKFKWIQTKLILFSIFFFLFFSSIVKCLNFIFVATGKDVVDEVAAVGAEVVETETKVALTQGLRFYPAFRILPFLFSEKNIVFSVIGTGDILYT